MFLQPVLDGLTIPSGLISLAWTAPPAFVWTG